MKRAIALLAMTVTSLLATVAGAHSPSEAMLALERRDDGVHLRSDIALRDLDARLDLDADRDGVLQWREVRTRLGELTAFVRRGIEVAADDRPCELLPGDDPALSRRGELA
jgi:hypothetical protein